MANTNSLSPQQSMAELYEIDSHLCEQLEAMSLATAHEGYRTLEPRKLPERKPGQPGSIDAWTREKFLGEGIKSCKSPAGAECSICMLEYDKKSHKAVTFVHGCKHIFGKECIQTWLNEQGKSTCPYCRTQLFQKDIDFSGEDEDGFESEEEEEVFEEEEEHHQSTSIPSFFSDAFVLREYTILGHPEELTTSGDKMPMKQTITNEEIERHVAAPMFHRLTLGNLTGNPLRTRKERRDFLIERLNTESFRASWTLFSQEQWRYVDTALEEADKKHGLFKDEMEHEIFADDSMRRVIPWLAKAITDAFEGAETTRNALLKHKSVEDIEALEEEPCCEGWDCGCCH